MSKTIKRKVTHDRLFKKNMANINVPKDMIRNILPDEYLEKIKLETLAQYKTEFIHAFSQKQTIADVVFSAELQNGDSGLIYIHIEAQSKPDQLMPLRMIEVMIALQRHYWENNGKKMPLPIVMPIILYNGDSPYPYSTNWLDSFDPSLKSLACDSLTKSMLIISLSDIPDSDLTKNARASLMFYALKYIRKKGWNDLLQGVINMLEQLQIDRKLDKNELITLFCYVLEYLVDNCGDVPLYEELNSSLEEVALSLPGEIGETIMTAREILINEGIRRGRQEGRKEGRQEGQRDLILAMISKGVSDSQIRLCTGLTSIELALLKAEVADTTE